MHILLGEESSASIEDILAQGGEGEAWYCVPSAIGDVIHRLREEIREHVADTSVARQMEHRLLLLESLTAAHLRGRAFWSREMDS